MPFALDVMDIPSPHCFELDFPNTEAALCAGHSSMLLVAFLPNLYTIYVWIRQAAVVPKLALWDTLSLLQARLYRKGLSCQPTVHFTHLLGSDTI